MTDAEVVAYAQEFAVRTVRPGIVAALTGQREASQTLWADAAEKVGEELVAPFLVALMGAQSRIIGALVRHLATATGQEILAAWDAVATDLEFADLARRCGLEDG